MDVITELAKSPVDKEEKKNSPLELICAGPKPHFQ